MKNSLSSIVCVLALTICVPAAAKTWFHTACERILGSPGFRETPQMLNNEASLEGDAHRTNSFTSHHLKTRFQKLDFVKGAPLSLVVQSQLHSTMRWQKKEPPALLLFVHPELVGENWSTEDGKELSRSHALSLWIEDLPVLKPDGTVIDLIDIVLQEARHVRERNPKMPEFAVRVAPASTVDWLDVHSRHGDKLLVWLEGDLQNFQVKRTLMLMLDEAFRTLVSDPSFAEKKPANSNGDN